jgi:hypothetical protein
MGLNMRPKSAQVLVRARLASDPLAARASGGECKPRTAASARYIDSGASTPSRSSARAITRRVCTLKAILKSSSSPPTTWQSR